MKRADVYVDRKGRNIVMTDADEEERGLIARLRRRARTHPNWTDFGNFWTREVAAFYDARGLTRAATRRTAAYRIGQDLASRLGIAAGLVRPPDLRDDLEELIREQFRSRRAFCKATGITEDALNAFLAGRQEMPTEALNAALEKVGYRLHILPVREQKKTG
jgi:hypothetical protein